MVQGVTTMRVYVKNYPYSAQGGGKSAVRSAIVMSALLRAGLAVLEDLVPTPRAMTCIPELGSMVTPHPKETLDILGILATKPIRFVS